MKMKIYHAIKPGFGMYEPIRFPVGYRLVAHVDTDDINRAWELTQHIDHSWCKNPEVTMLIPEATRSTSVEDVIEHNGKYWMVAPIGFDEITPTTFVTYKTK